MRFSIGFSVYTIVFFFSLTIHANTVLEVPDKDFTEHYAENVDVSGSVLAASIVTGNIAFASPDSLFVYVPKALSTINLVLASIDGKYTAEASLALKPSDIGWLQIKLPSDYQKEYSKYLPNRLVTYAFADSEDIFGDYIQEVFPTSWGEPTSANLQLLMNSQGGNPNVTFKTIKQEVISRDCVKIIAEYTRVFNHLCELNKDEIAEKVIVTLSPEYLGSGKNYIVWSAHVD